MILSHSDSIENVLAEPVKTRLAYLKTLKTEIKLGISEDFARHDEIARSINYDLGGQMIFLFNNNKTKNMAKKIVEQAPEPVVVKKGAKKTAADLMGEEKPVKSKVATAADLMGTVAPKKKSNGAILVASGGTGGGQKEIISGLAAQGMDIKEIQEETGIKINNIRWYFSKLGLREVVEKAQAAKAKQAKKTARVSA